MRDMWAFTLKTVIVATVGVMAVGAVIIIPFFLLIGSLASLGSASYESEMAFGSASAPNTFLSIPVKGVIEGEPSSEGDSFFGLDSAAYGYEIKKKLFEAANDDGYAG